MVPNQVPKTMFLSILRTAQKCKQTFFIKQSMNLNLIYYSAKGLN